MEKRIAIGQINIADEQEIVNVQDESVPIWKK